MRLFGLQITRPKAQTLSGVPSTAGWWGVIRESFAGAWQANVTVDTPRNILAFSAVFSCVTGIANDIAKLGARLVEDTDDGICVPAVDSSPYWTVLRKPNRYQTWTQFLAQWLLSKLLFGNTYVLKERDARGIVTALYVLDAQRVKPLVAEDGGVYYEISVDHLAGLDKSVTVPGSELIHDRWNCLWHPLVGISPIYACGMSATMGNKIQANSTRFFSNMSRPSGMLTAPNKIDDETAQRLKATFEESFSGANIGRLLVGGNGLAYSPFTMPANDAQLIEQLKWTVEDVARAFHYPMFKLTGTIPTGVKPDLLDLIYYKDCLQPLIEDLEACLGEGMSLPGGYSVELELDGLLRMDAGALNQALGEGVKGGFMSPNEARKRVNLPPVSGGESPYLQQQNFSLAALAKRDALENPFVIDKPTTNPTPSAGGPASEADPKARWAETLAILTIMKAKSSAMAEGKIGA